MKIFRQQLLIIDDVDIFVPKGTKPLSVAPGRGGNDHLDLWYSIPDSFPDERVGMSVHIAGTGPPIEPEVSLDDFIGTCVMPNGLVWHVFARVNDQF